MFQRIFLFLITNFIVITTISILASLFGGLSNTHVPHLVSLLIFCFCYGMIGSFVSLSLSRYMAKKSMGIQLIDDTCQDAYLLELHNVVKDQARSMLLPMPEFGIFKSNSPNAFATGRSKNSSLVALSTTLVETCDKESIKAIIGHEMAHIANGDMVTMTLLQGVVNTFVLFFSRIVFYAVSRSMDRKVSYIASIAIYYLTQTVLFFFGSIVTCAFSRRREYKADKGGADITSKESMISALEYLSKYSEKKTSLPREARAMMISSPQSLTVLFSTHPTIENRVKALKELI